MPANHFDDLINEKNEAAFKEEYCKPQPQFLVIKGLGLNSPDDSKFL